MEAYSSLYLPAASQSPTNQHGTMVKDALLMEKFISAECVHKITRLRELCGLAAALARLVVTAHWLDSSTWPQPMAERLEPTVRQYGCCLAGRVTLSSGVIYAGPKLWARTAAGVQL